MISVCDVHCLLYLKSNDNITLSKKGITALKIIDSVIKLLISIKGCLKSIIPINSDIFHCGGFELGFFGFVFVFLIKLHEKFTEFPQ